MRHLVLRLLSSPLRSANVVPRDVPTGLSTEPLPVPPPPPPPRISRLLVYGDACVVGVYLLCGSVAMLVAAEGGEAAYEVGLALTMQELRDVLVAVDSAGPLAIGWLLAAALCGALDVAWPERNHEQSRFGAAPVLSTCLVGWPVGRLLGQCAEVVVSHGRVDLIEPPAGTVAEAIAAASGDALGLLVVMVRWRRYMLLNHKIWF